MDVWSMAVVNAQLVVTFLGAFVLLGVAVWWAWAGDGIAIPRGRWPWPVRLAAVAGWTLWAGGIVLQVVGYFVQVGVARWPTVPH